MSSNSSSNRYGSDQAPTAASVEARRTILAAVASGDVAMVTAHHSHEHPHVRAAAVVGMQRLDALTPAAIAAAAEDPIATVRRQLAQLGATDRRVPLDRLLGDADARVAEVSAWAFGERVEVTDTELAALQEMTTGHDDALCREAAVAALGAIGDERSLPAILAATQDKATVRRRAVLALAPFDTPEVDDALERALSDRDWQVRQAAEDLLL